MNKQEESDQVGFGVHFGKRVREARMMGEAKTIADLAAQANISEAYLKKIEAQSVDSPSFKVVVRLARLLGIDINELAALVSAGIEELEEEGKRVFEAFPEVEKAYFHASTSMDAKTKRRVLKALAEIVDNAKRKDEAT